MNQQILRLLFTTWIVIIGSVFAFAEPSGRTTPKIELKTIAGETITNASLAGKPTLLMFWATWCGACRQELPKIKALYQEKKRTLRVVAIGFQDEESNVRRYVKEHPDTFNFPVAYDTDNRVSDSFFLRATPTFFLLDKNGKIAMTHVGGGILQNPTFWKALEPS